MKFERLSGLILHPTSLPGPYGIGDLGPEALAWLDFLAASGCGLWQILPLGPTSYGDSPYQCFSAFAGNPYLISPQRLLEEDLLHPDDLVDAPEFPPGQVDYGRVISWKLGVLDRAALRFEQQASAALRQEFETFSAATVSWLPDYALFMALKEAHGGQPWTTWEPELRRRDRAALEAANRTHQSAVKRQILRQFFFFRQWQALRQAARARGVFIIGDAPIFVAHDSADVWANPELFFLDEAGQSTVVAGVPPDYFSPTGQLWGNPIYRWDEHARSGYAWWQARLQAVLQLVDVVRLDHFRGFAGYWEIPADAPTAETGQWMPGPGLPFFQQMADTLGSLPIIAEDLGEITPDVLVLRDALGLPGMKILQFAFGSGPQNKFLPHTYPENCVVYTGTHDNDTTLGWYLSAPEWERDFCRRYLGRDGREVVWDLIRLGWSSTANFALAPMQDLLGLDGQARMNFPGRASGNWSWRLTDGYAHPNLAARVYELNMLYDRLPKAASSRVTEAETSA